MAEVRVNQVPLDIVRRLLLFDRWTASRTWPDGYRSGGDRVNAVESGLLALTLNPKLDLPLPEIFSLAQDSDPLDLIGADDKDVLRDGTNLGVVIDSGDDGLRVTLPGLVSQLLQQPEFTRDIPRFERSFLFFTVSVGAQDIRLRPSLREGNVRIRWNAAGPELVVDIDFETEGEEITGTIGIDWDRVNVTLRCRPQVIEERLRWDFGLRVHLEPEATLIPASTAQHQVAKGVDDALRPLVARWGTLAMSIMLLLPLRPMRDDDKFFARLADTDGTTLGFWLLDQFYHPDVPESWRHALIHSCLLPHQPLRSVAVNSAALSTKPVDFFYARLADRYVRHLGPPMGTDNDDNGPAIDFDVAPIQVDGNERALADPMYGAWYIPSYDQSPRNGEHCVLREQFLIQLANLQLAQRSYSVSAGGPWRVRGQILVRHRNLADNRWARMQSFDFVTESSNFVLPGTTGSQWFEWLELRGDVRVAGTIEDGSGSPVGWFDQSAAVGPLPAAVTGQTNGGGIVALRDFDSGESPPLGDERRASALIRLVQQTSLRRYMLDWLGLTLNALELTGGAQKALLNGVYEAPVMDAGMLRVLVNGQIVGVVTLSAQQLGELQAGRRVRFPVSTSRYDLYFAPDQESLKLDIELGVLGDSGSFETLLSATRTVTRSDPGQPQLVWHIPPGVPGRQLRVANDDGLDTTLYLQDAFFDEAEVDLQHRPKPMQIGLTRIEVVEPTELWIFNWRVMRFSLRVWAELGGEQVGRARTLDLGPFTQATPTVLAFKSKDEVFDDRDFRRDVDVPAGAVIRIEVSGREVGEGAIPVGETDLGVAVETFTVAMDEDPEVGADAVEAQSTTTDYFRFHSVQRVRARPPQPQFEPRDAMLVEDGLALTLASGASLEYDYGTVPWTTALQLRWCEGHEASDDDDWSTLDEPPITHEGTAAVTIDWPAGSTRRLRLRARNRRGSTRSAVLFLTVT